MLSYLFIKFDIQDFIQYFDKIYKINIATLNILKLLIKFKLTFQNDVLVSVLKREDNNMKTYKSFIFLFTIFCIVKTIKSQNNDISNSILNIGKSILNEDLKNQNVNMEAISPLCIVGALSLLQLGSVGVVFSDLRNFMNQDTGN